MSHNSPLRKAFLSRSYSFATYQYMIHFPNPTYQHWNSFATLSTSTISSTGGSIFFFREFEEPYGFMSQWYPCSFTAPAPPSAGKNAPQMTFLTTEQYMMYQKAIVFKDDEIANKIILEPNLRKQKGLGRKVKGFDPKKWDKEKQKVVEDGNWWKFTQPKEGNMRKMLLGTGHRELVEVS